MNNNRSFATFGAFSAGNIQWPLTNDGPPTQVNVAAMTASAFELVGAFPQRGRFPTAERTSRTVRRSCSSATALGEQVRFRPLDDRTYDRAERGVS